jgi:hypothetical protein
MGLERLDVRERILREKEIENLQTEGSLGRDGKIKKLSLATKRRLVRVWRGMLEQNKTIQEHTSQARAFIRPAVTADYESPRLSNLFEKYQSKYNEGNTYSSIDYLNKVLGDLDGRLN